MKNIHMPTDVATQLSWRRRRSAVARASVNDRRNDARPCESAIDGA
jgi:hypothetical protein